MSDEHARRTTHDKSAYRVRLLTESGIERTVDVEAESEQEAFVEACGYECWEIGVNGEFHNGFHHFTVFAEDGEAAKEKVLDQESKAHSLVNHGHAKLGIAHRAEMEGEK